MIGIVADHIESGHMVNEGIMCKRTDIAKGVVSSIAGSFLFNQILNERRLPLLPLLFVLRLKTC
jgi:uncharacterized membrane protein YeaQ/YmgE (transglycosylase-associated protein family)